MRIYLATALIALLPFGAAAQSLSEAEVKELALEAILENPQIIMDALAIIQEQRAQAEAIAQAQALEEQRIFLETDPNAPFVGNPDAGTVIVEFFDYNCPYCKRAAGNVKELIAQDDDLRVMYREWPILGEGSVLATRAALAARNQGKYEEMHWGLMELRGRAEEASIMSLARDIGLDLDQLQIDMQSDAVTAHIAASDQLAKNLGFTGTPSFVIGEALIPGAVPLEDLQEFIAQARAAK